MTADVHLYIDDYYPATVDRDPTLKEYVKTDILFTTSYYTKGGDMPNSKEYARQMMEVWSKKYLAMSKYPDFDPCEDGDIIFFEVRFPQNKMYRYAAIRSNELWYTTGPSAPKAYTWEQLVNWLNDRCDAIYLMQVGKRIVPVEESDSGQE